VKHTLMMLMMCVGLATPILAMANDQTIPPESNWTLRRLRDRQSTWSNWLAYSRKRG